MRPPDQQRNGGAAELLFDDVDYWAELWKLDQPVSRDNVDDNRAYLAAMRVAGMAATGVFGLRMMWRSTEDAAACLRTACGNRDDLASNLQRVFGPMVFIHLSRRDKLAQAVSLVRAEQTGLWHLAADGSERERLAPARPPVFDADHIRRTEVELRCHDRKWSEWFDQNRIVPVRMWYEDTAADHSAALATVLRALGFVAAAHANIGAETARMADAISASWIARMRA